eukprot:g4485.t1
MTILYSLVARGKTVLAEFTFTTGNFPTITRVLLGKIPPEDSKMSYVYDQHVFHYRVDDGLTFLCMADEDSRRRIPFAFLQEIKNRFQATYGDRGATAAAFAMNEDFSRTLENQMDVFNSPDGDQILATQQKLDEVKDVMVASVELVLERGERLELLVDKTDNLQQQAFHIVEPESDALALSDILQIGEEIDSGGLPDVQDDEDADDEFQDGDLSHPGGNLHGHRRFGRVDTPLRVEPPPSFNAPARPVDQTQEQQIKASAFSPAAFTMRKHEIQAQTHSLLGSKNSAGGSSTSSLLGNLRQRQEPTVRGHSENQASYRTAMSDYHMLAFSSQRSGRHEMEGLAYYSAGVTMDSTGQYPKALESYKKFLVVCTALKDPFIEGVCHNCMGVDYMLMACPPGSSMQDSVTELPARAVSLLRKALEHHEGHLKGADDAGSGVAHSNMGLCHGWLGDYQTAAKHHQEALRVALRVQSASAQSVAVGNLGTLAMRQGDRQTAQACLEQHLQLVQQLGDWQGEINAWSKIAQLAAGAGEASAQGGEEAGGGEENAGGVRAGVGPAGRAVPGGGVAGAIGQDAVARALWCFERAATLAKTHDEVSTLKRLHCDMGVVRGNASMDDYFRSLRTTAV